jgi:hypothetical protein
MAKKTRRSRRKRKAAPTRVPSARQQQPVPVKGAAVAAKASSAKVDLAEEYHYVFSDLRRIAIIAAVMFALLFALAFVMR